MSNRIVSITRFINFPVNKFERFDVYKINGNDIPFLNKVFGYLDKRKTKLDGVQEELHKQFKRLLSDEYCFNSPYNREGLYIGVRDDNYITGIMTTDYEFNYRRVNKMTSLFTTREEPIIKDSFIYAIERDTKKGFASHYHITGENFGMFKKDQIPGIEQKHSGWNFDTSKPNKEYDLEEVLGL